MSYTKGELVRAALGEIGIADYEFDVTPEELSSGVSRLDAMMSNWSDKNIQISYNYVGGPGDESGLPSVAEEAVIANLAVRIAPSYGKEASMTVRAVAKMGLNSLLSESARPPEMQHRGYPIGAGYKNLDLQKFFRPTDTSSWKIDDYDDYSGGSASIQVGDVGTVIRIAVAGTADLSGVTTSSIRYRKPSGTTGEWTGTVNGDAIEYQTVAGDMDEAGVWYIQAFFDLGSWSGSSKVASIRVGESITLD